MPDKAMPEMRLNLVTREWVIIATERAKRPVDFRSSHDPRPATPPYLSSCPFCAGNEGHTPEERSRFSERDKWKVRIINNKYPALDATGERARTLDGLFHTVAGVGVHEVIVESPVHNDVMALMETGHIEEIIRLYRQSFIAAYNDPRVEHVIIFKNQGEGSGTSIRHPHTQLIGIPVVPIQVRDRVRAAMHYFDDTGDCLICATLAKEREDGVRVLIDTEHFMTFIPYAALSPFHTWIFPKRHTASFSEITDAEIKDAAFHLKSLLEKFYHGLENPDYNFVLRSSRPKDKSNEYCHWYISVVPRLSRIAGFELGSGMYINTTMPEQSAEFLRSAGRD